jgi:hypothetical protein
MKKLCVSRFISPIAETPKDAQSKKHSKSERFAFAVSTTNLEGFQVHCDYFGRFCCK